MTTLSPLKSDGHECVLVRLLLLPGGEGWEPDINTEEFRGIS